MNTIFSGLITSKMRIKILMRLFLNPDQNTYLRQLAREFNASPSQIQGELQQLSNAGLITKTKDGRQINYQAEEKHPLFPELHSMVKKALGMDQIIDSIIARLGQLEEAWLIDDYAEGKDTGIIDLVLVGIIDQSNLADLTAKTERYIERKIRTLAITRNEFDAMRPMLEKRTCLLLWSSTNNQGQGENR